MIQTATFHISSKTPEEALDKAHAFFMRTLGENFVIEKCHLDSWSDDGTLDGEYTFTAKKISYPLGVISATLGEARPAGARWPLDRSVDL